MLVSQWSVDDEATRALLTATLAERELKVRPTLWDRIKSDILRKRNATPSLARELHDAMFRLMDSGNGGHAYFSHPYAWAPFVVVGEGNSVR